MNDSLAEFSRTETAASINAAFLFDLALILFGWLLTELVVHPIGNFPLNDDFSFALTVKHLLATGDYRPLSFTGMSLITNALWGALFCLPDGFSFNALRVSTLVASILGLIACYTLVRDMHQSRFLAVITTLTLGFNPIYYALSHSFMTDVLFVSLTLWATVFLSRSLKRNSNTQMLVGGLFAVAAILSRQIAIFIPLAFILTVLLRRPVTMRAVLPSAVPLILCTLAILVFNFWLSTSGRWPESYGHRTQVMFQTLADMGKLTRNIFGNLYVALVYLGFFTAPVLLMVPGRFSQLRDRRVQALLTSALLAILGGMLTYARFRSEFFGTRLIMPLGVDYLDKSGIGPFTLRDTSILHLDHISAMPTGFWIAVTAIGIAGGILLTTKLGFSLLDLFNRFRRHQQISDSDLAGTFFLLCGIIYLLPLLVVGFVDRYLIPAVPFLAIGIIGFSTKTVPISCPHRSTILRASATSILAALGIYAVCGTRDYFTWNRLRWQALEALTSGDHISAEDIDGGFEFNGWYLYDPGYPKAFLQKAPNPESLPSWWWVHRDTYLIAFGPVPGYSAFREYTYSHWLPPHTQRLLVLRRK